MTVIDSATENVAYTESEGGIISWARPKRVDVDLVIPVYNEEEELDDSVRLLASYLLGRTNEFGAPVADGTRAAFTWNIVIADNASTDFTWAIAAKLCEDFPGFIRAIHLDEKGRGRALKTAWGQSQARVVAYMDVDLSTSLANLDDLILPLLGNQADLAIGSRLLPQSRIRRSIKREFISRSYNLLLRTYCRARFHDAQCGFKALRLETARKLLPLIQDDAWFFDTELLLLAQYQGLRLREIPVRWVEDAGSTVDIFDTAVKDLQGMARTRRTLNSLSSEGTGEKENARAKTGANATAKAGAGASANPAPALLPDFRGALIPRKLSYTV